MSDAEKGQFGLCTGAENSVDAAVRAVLGETNVAPLLPGLVDDQPDDLDVLGKIAENLNAQRRARGRPEGSANRRNAEMFDYLEARGFKAPEVRMMEIVSADTIELARMMRAEPLEVLKLQAKVAGDLLPFKFAKRQELNVNHQGAVAHVMMAGRLVAPGEGPVKEWSLTGQVDELSNEINIDIPPVGQPGVG